jgi:predicted RecB family nuclease
LKQVEQLTGFERQLTDAGGDWSMARYIEATETNDAELRDSIMDEILEYNREDLEAIWAVLGWLRHPKSRHNGSRIAYIGCLLRVRSCATVSLPRQW